MLHIDLMHNIQVERWMIQKAKDADKVNMENELQVRYDNSC